jgi:hypothetical protein
MWDPEAFHVRSSFVQPVADPSTAPADAPLVQLNVNASWVPYIIGCLMQMAQPRAWTTTDPTALADLLGRVTDLMNMFGTAMGPMEIQLSATGVLQTSTDGGTTWVDVPGWSTNIPDVVHDLQARVTMDPAYASPPIPEEITGGADWLYSDNGEG